LTLRKVALKIAIVLNEVLELNRIRIDRDLTYEDLAREIHGVTRQAIYRILNTPNPKMHDRTLAKIRKYIDRVRASEAA
jgi:DNA-binding Xre family transcriptional regulator